MHNVIILGSGRSRTSMTAGVLSQAGYFMGHKVLNKGRVNNPFGNWEDQDVNHVNEQLLSQVIPQPEVRDGVVHHRDRPVDTQRWLGRLPVGTDIPSLPACVSEIEELTRHEPFCFKDPRFSYTLPVWRPHLANTVYVCVFRDAHKTAQSMLKQIVDAPHLRGLEMTLAAAIDVWSLMYRHILEIHSRDGAWLFLRYDQVLTGDGLKRLSRFTGARVNRDFPKSELRRDYRPVEMPAEVAVLQHRNVGIPRNRNTALRCVTGNYVGILDGDDLFVPEKLELQRDARRRHPARGPSTATSCASRRTRPPRSLSVMGVRKPEETSSPRWQG